jgi:hypothetical protein
VVRRHLRRLHFEPDIRKKQVKDQVKAKEKAVHFCAAFFFEGNIMMQKHIMPEYLIRLLQTSELA